MIAKLLMQNFRGIQERTLEMGPGRVKIEGPNEAGKSTVKEAFHFVFAGTDSAGLKNPDHLIKDGEEQAVVAIDTGKAVFTRKKKRGATSVLTMERFGAPAIKMSQTELWALLKMNHDIFGSLTTVGFFMALPDARRVAVINDLVGIDRKALIEAKFQNANIPWRLVDVANIKGSITNIERERRMIQNQRTAAEGSIRELLAQTEVSGGSTNLEEDKQLLSELSQKKALVELDERSSRDYQQELSRFQSALATYNQHVAKQKSLKESLEALPVVKPWTKADTESVQKFTGSLQAEIDVLYSQKKPTPAAPTFKSTPSGETCPTCNQVVTSEHRAKVQEEKNAAITAYNQLEREVANHNTALDQEIARLRAQWKNIAAEAEIDRKAWQDNQEARSGLSAAIQAIGHPLEPDLPAPPVFNFSPEDGGAVLKAYEQIHDRVKLAMGLSARTESARARLVQYRNDSAQYSFQIDGLLGVEEFLKKLPEIELEQTLQKIALPGVEVKIVDGVLDVRVKGIPYSSLSDGRKMKVDFLWVQCFRSLSKNPPGFCFCDNADLVDSFEGVVPQNVQVLFANVNRQLSELQTVNL